MATRILTGDEVREALPMRACIDAVEGAFRTLARGRAANPLRHLMRIPDHDGIVGMMPGALGGEGADGTPDLGIKAVAVFPGNHGTRYDAHQGVVVLFDGRHGVPEAILDASAVTAIRTAAASAVATRALAREGARTLALLGSGVEARTHLEAIREVRPIEAVRVWSPTPDNRERFAAEAAARHDVRIEACDDARSAVEGADVVCTVSSAKEPILPGAWLEPGMHVNAVGSSVRTAREIDGHAMARARLFVDREESTRNESGDFLLAIEEGTLAAEAPLTEIGEVLEGRAAGRGSAEEITLYESLGLAVQDVAAARAATERARQHGIGIDVELGGRR